MKFCGKCGKQLEDNDLFCRGCGAGVPTPAEPAAANQGMESALTLNLDADNNDFSNGQEPPIPNESETTDSPANVDDYNDSVFPGALTPSDTQLSKKKKLLSAMQTKVLIASLLAIVLAAGGIWGWQNFGTEARVQKKLDLAVKYLSENDYEKAVLAFNDAIKIDPKEVKAYQGLARTYTIQGKYDEAQSTYDRGLAAVAAEKKPTLQIGLAGMYIDQGKLDKAEQAFQEINNSDQSCLEAYFGLAIVYQQKGDNTKAEGILRKAVKNNPNEYRAYNTLALYFKQNNKADDSFNSLVKSLSLEMNQQEAYLILTDLYKGNWNILQSNVSLIKDKQIAAMVQFYSYYASEDYTKAITMFKESLSQQNGNQKARILTAIAMLKQGDKPGAEALIKQLDNDKLNEWLLSDLARFYLEAGDKDKAKTYALKALQANPTNLDAIVILQAINVAEANAKVYTAQALLYNWKPVVKVKEELKEKSLIVLNGTEPAKPEGSNQQTSDKSDSKASSEPQVKSGRLHLAEASRYGMSKSVVCPTDSSTTAIIINKNDAYQLVLKTGTSQTYVTNIAAPMKYVYIGVGDFAWSPDGKMIAYSYNEHTGMSDDPRFFTILKVYDLESKTSKSVNTIKGESGAFGPVWRTDAGGLYLGYQTVISGRQIDNEPGHWRQAADGTDLCFGREFWIENREVKWN